MTDNIDKDSNVFYEGRLPQILQTRVFTDWLNRLSDRRSRLRIVDRIKRVAAGNLGDTKSVGNGVQELRMTFGPAYRIYYMHYGESIIILLYGGDKSSQSRDIKKATNLAMEIRDGNGIDTFRPG